MDKNQTERENKNTQERAQEAINRARSVQSDINRAKTGARAAEQGGKLATQAAANAGRAGTQVAVQAAAAAAEAATEAATAATTAAGSIAAISIGGIVLLVVVVVVILAGGFIFFFQPPPTAGGTPDCTGICKVACSVGSETSDPNAICPTSSSGTSQVCCIPPSTVTCADISGSCTSAGNCNNPKKSDPLISCPDPANPVCCYTPGTQPNIKFFCQYYKPNGSPSCDLVQAGCDPSSIAMIGASFGLSVTPLSIALNNGNIGCNGTATLVSAAFAAANNTFPSSQFSVVTGLVSGSTLNTALVANLTSNGYIILGEGCMTFNSSASPYGGHSVVISGVNPDGTVKTYDPTYCTSNTNYTVRSLDPKVGGSDMRSGGLCGAGNSGWYDAIAIRIK